MRGQAPSSAPPGGNMSVKGARGGKAIPLPAHADWLVYRY